ncbi:carboxypeptidase regulatory-like domain-containing protein, partial [Gemmatimonas sp.]|uniref:carboxypeptidase regulatory-like domain-containing protein n=1 Tax=Gemmatimonas sp. TaxID=1962908 RepID=UPI00391F34CE
MKMSIPRVVRAMAAAVLAVVVQSGTLAAQDRTGVVAGRVIEAGGAPIPNAQVSIAGTTLGSLTNAEGRFTLRGVPAGNVTVRVARIGYAESTKPAVITAGSTTTLDFSLTKVAVNLTAVVTTATGDQRRLEIPNQIAQIDAAKAIESAQISNVGDLLIGKAAGVQLLPGSGVNAASRIRIRGTSSISLSNDPIILVDGIRINSSTAGLGTGGSPAGRLN